VVSPNPLSPTPSTFSAMKTRQNMEEDCKAANQPMGRYPNGILL